jgi:hypothetical protein
MSRVRIYGPAQLPTAATLIYVCPPNTTSVIYEINVSNPTGATQTFTLSIGIDAAGDRLFSAVSIPAGGRFSKKCMYVLSPGTVIQASASSTSVVIILSGNEDRVGPHSYSTTFTTSSSPIFDNAWLSGNDPLQSEVDTSGGLAIGTQTGNEASGGNFNDSEAYLSGFPQNHSAQATIHLVAGINPAAFQEVEILLRWSVGSLRTGLAFGDTHSQGYECNLAFDASYVQIGRFKETPALYDSHTDPVPPGGVAITTLGVQDGDVMKAQILGNTISVYLIRSGTANLIAQGTDGTATPFLYGNPGIGFFRDNAGHGSSATDPVKFCFTDFSAVSL